MNEWELRDLIEAMRKALKKRHFKMAVNIRRKLERNGWRVHIDLDNDGEIGALYVPNKN